MVRKAERNCHEVFKIWGKIWISQESDDTDNEDIAEEIRVLMLITVMKILVLMLILEMMNFYDEKVFPLIKLFF